MSEAARADSTARSRRSSRRSTTGGRDLRQHHGPGQGRRRDRPRSRARGRSSSPPTTPRTSTRSCIGSWLIPTARAADPLARQEGAVRLADRRLGGGATAASTRSIAAPPTSRRSGSPPRILDEGHVLFVFPEGTRSPDGSLQEARDGVAVLALRTGAPIVPIGIAGSNRVWPKGQKLPHPGGHVTVRVGEPFRPADLLPAGTDRRTAKGLVDDDDHGAHRGAPAAVAARRLRRRTAPVSTDGRERRTG